MSFRDERPPINETLHYAVVAVRGEAAAVPAPAEPVVVRPEPAGLELAAGDAAVTGRWALPPQAAGAVVVRSFAGRSVTVEADRLGFTDRDVQNDTAYQYRVSAVYLDEDGHEQVTRGIVASVTPSAPPTPVEEIRLVPDTLDATRLLVAFAPPTRGNPEVVLLPGPPPWPYGTIVSVGEARDAGRPLPATPTAEGLAVRTRGGGVLLVVTVSGRFAAIGPHQRHVSLPAPTGLTAELRGGHLHVGFDWPPDVPEARLTLVSVGLGEETLRITRAAYEAQGVRIPIPDGFAGAEVVVAACAGSMVGPAASVVVEGRRVVGYDVERSGPRWRRSLAVRLRAEGARPVRIGELRLVVRPGRVMPNRASDGETLQEWRDLEVDGELTLTVPEPAVKQPYWLRCFTADERLELADPPIRRLQVT
jgi:hypothetical protein